MFEGWRRILGTDAREEEREAKADDKARKNEDEYLGRGPLPKLSKGEDLEVLAVEVAPHTTRPRPMFTQASIVAELERLGIGRPSTYATLVPLLLTRGWVVEQAADIGGGRKGGGDRLAVLVPTAVGLDLCDFLLRAFAGLVDFQFTAALEAALDDLASGKRTRRQVVGAWWQRFDTELTSAKLLEVQGGPERKSLGPCPRCTAEGRPGRLRLLAGISGKTGRPYEFAACDQDTKDNEVCGLTAPTQGGELQKLLPCPDCRKAMRPVRRKDGGHSWKCEQHGWLLAGKAWELVTSPPCPTCRAPMSHRERTAAKGEFFWGCFADREFVPSDAYGGMKRAEGFTRR